MLLDVFSHTITLKLIRPFRSNTNRKQYKFINIFRDKIILSNLMYFNILSKSTQCKCVYTCTFPAKTYKFYRRMGWGILYGNWYTRIYIANEITLMSFLEPLWVYQGFQSTKLRL